AMLLSTFAPVIKQFQLENPDVRVEYNVTREVARLEVGEAHVAIRTGLYQQMEDTIMLPLVSVRSALYAHESYVERYGKPEKVADFRDHRFVSRVLGREMFPLFQWLHEQVDPENIVFMSDDTDATTYAVLEGIGIGFLPVAKARAWPRLVEVLPYDPEWNVDFWLVTHVDNHQMQKIQALLSTFRQMGLLTRDEEFSDILPAKTTT
ncbi:MAG: LysR substrate-binding domain-containing protein, partial [Pseudomonadota bacterium]